MSSEMSKFPKKPGQNAAVQEEGTEKCANEAFLVEEADSPRNDDGEGLVDCPENSALMELKRPKFDLKVSDKSENTASNDSQGGDASGKQTSLTEPMAREADPKPEQKLDALEEQAAKGTMPVDNPGKDSGADNSEEVLNAGSVKSVVSDHQSCSRFGKSNRWGEPTSDERKAAIGMLVLRYSFDGYGGTGKSRNEARAIEEEELSRKHSRQALAGCPEKSAVIEVERKKAKLDREVVDNSVVMQEDKQKVYLDAPSPSNGEEEESSDIIDGEANQTA